jgi:hypothetical protein
MSVFIKFSRPGSSDKVVRVKAAHSRFGLDAFGIPCFESPVTAWGSLLVTGSEGVVIPETSALKIEGRNLLTREALRLKDGTTCSIGEVTLSFFFTSPAAEALSETPEITSALDSSYTLEELPSLTYTLPSIGRTIPLFPGASYSLGSDISCALYLPLAGVAPHHAVISVTSYEVTILSQEGCLDLVPAVGGRMVSALPVTARLLPTGIPLSFRAGATRGN